MESKTSKIENKSHIILHFLNIEYEEIISCVMKKFLVLLDLKFITADDLRKRKSFWKDVRCVCHPNKAIFLESESSIFTNVWE